MKIFNINPDLIFNFSIFGGIWGLWNWAHQVAMGGKFWCMPRSRRKAAWSVPYNHEINPDVILVYVVYVAAVTYDSRQKYGKKSCFWAIKILLASLVVSRLRVYFTPGGRARWPVLGYVNPYVKESLVLRFPLRLEDRRWLYLYCKSACIRRLLQLRGP